MNEYRGMVNGAILVLAIIIFRTDWLTHNGCTRYFTVRRLPDVEPRAGQPSFGGLAAVNNVSFDVQPGQIMGFDWPQRRWEDDID